MHDYCCDHAIDMNCLHDGIMKSCKLGLWGDHDSDCMKMTVGHFELPQTHVQLLARVSWKWMHRRTLGVQLLWCMWDSVGDDKDALREKIEHLVPGPRSQRIFATTLTSESELR